MRVLYGIAFLLVSLVCLWLTGSWIAALAAACIVTALVVVLFS